MEARIKKSNTREMRIRTRETGCFLKLTVGVYLKRNRLFHDFVAKFLDYRVCQDFSGHALNLLFGGFAGHPV